MFLRKILSLIIRLEDPSYPSMGPIVKGLKLFGLGRSDTKFRNFVFYFVHFSTVLFVISQFADLYRIKNDINLALNNMSVTVLSLICAFKTLSYVLTRSEWENLTEEISEVESQQLHSNDETAIKHLKIYIHYTRVIASLYWVLVFMTNLFLIFSPFSKYLSQQYREDFKNGKEVLPQILCSWFPFDNNKMPGYFVGIFVHVIMGCQGSGVIAVYDMNAVAMMSYLRGQTIILREKCREIFDGEEITGDIVLHRIKECHKNHNTLIKHYKKLNSLLSPIMFLYVLVCSITICTSVVQFTSKEATTSQKFWVIEYTLALISQLFLYCWHGNEVASETRLVDRGVYESNWWKGDKKLKKQIHLLAAKLDKKMILKAGPYTVLSVSTFIDILKGSYSFYTLFSQMQDA